MTIPACLFSVHSMTVFLPWALSTGVKIIIATTTTTTIIIIIIN